jgi:Na+/melibiose symporter-like transporter
MMALPIYVVVPKFYADATGLSLTLIGTVLLATRLLDAFADPLLGGWVDVSRRRSSHLRLVLLAMPLLALGFVLLFSPAVALNLAISPAIWLGVTLTAAYLGYSLASIAYQAWGAELAHDDAGRARVTAAREGAGLIGVILASVVPVLAGIHVLTAMFLFVLALALGLLARHAPRPGPPSASATPTMLGLLLPLARRNFRWLLLVFVVNGIAAAIPATLVLFFVADRLQLAGSEGLFLALYFVAGAASMLLWARLARRIGLQLSWLVGMVAAVTAFVWAYWLDAGDLVAFALICILSGAALGADLALPPALLARVIDANGDTARREGAYFGLWNFVNKLNLALAAGVALPALHWLGFTPGARGASALDALSLSYALIPCALKLLAAALLLVAWRRHAF